MAAIVYLYTTREHSIMSVYKLYRYGQPHRVWVLGPVFSFFFSSVGFWPFWSEVDRGLHSAMELENVDETYFCAVGKHWGI